MEYISKNIWDWYKEGAIIIIPTNGTVTKYGRAVMERGLALQAKRMFPGIDTILGDLLTHYGNQVHFIDDRIVSFPVKHNWYGKADIKLIEKSARELRDIFWVLISASPKPAIAMPKVGCGNGKLNWKNVSPIIQKHLGGIVNIVDFKSGSYI